MFNDKSVYTLRQIQNKLEISYEVVWIIIKASKIKIFNFNGSLCVMKEEFDAYANKYIK